MRIRFALPIIVALSLTACGSAPVNTTTARTDDSQQACQSSIGSSICRRGDSGVQPQSNTISGEDLRRSGTITGAQPGVIPD